jgi:hypothetical protein
LKLREAVMHFSDKIFRVLFAVLLFAPLARLLRCCAKSAVMTKDQVRAVLEVVKSPKAQQVKPEDFYDNSFMQKLDASGFINSLYPR